MIALLDLKAQNGPLQDEIDRAVLGVARSGRYVLGPEVEAFEAEWAAYCGVDYCIGTGNALDALRIMLMALEIGPGDEVLVASNTYIATWLAVSLVGAKPVPVEPDLLTMNMDPVSARAMFTPDTAAILATHLYGSCANLDELSDLARQHNVPLLFDAAQAHGARYAGGQRAGSGGRAEAFSFYPSKNLGALGDAGCITTNGAEFAARARRLRNYGGVGRLDHTIQGVNSRLDEMQAAVLRVKLPWLDQWNERRFRRAEAYWSGLGGQLITLPALDTRSVFHQFVVRHPRRDALAAALERNGVEAHVHYPVPPHMEGAYRLMNDVRLPACERLAKEVLSLPIGYKFDQPAVIEAMIRALAEVEHG